MRRGLSARWGTIIVFLFVTALVIAGGLAFMSLTRAADENRIDQCVTYGECR